MKFPVYKKVKHKPEPKKWWINTETGESLKLTRQALRKRLLDKYPPLQAKRMIADWREATLSETFDLEVAQCK